jgi:hypothetical protein
LGYQPQANNKRPATERKGRGGLGKQRARCKGKEGEGTGLGNQQKTKGRTWPGQANCKEAKYRVGKEGAGLGNQERAKGHHL